MNKITNKVISSCDYGAVWLLTRGNRYPVVSIITNTITIALKVFQELAKCFCSPSNYQLAKYLNEKSFYQCFSDMNPFKGFQEKDKKTEGNKINNKIENNNQLEENFHEPEKQVKEKENSIIENKVEEPTSDEELKLKEKVNLEKENPIIKELFPCDLDDQDGIIECLCKDDKYMLSMNFDLKEFNNFFEIISEKYKDNEKFLEKILEKFQRDITNNINKCFCSLPYKGSKFFYEFFIPKHLENITTRQPRIEKFLLLTLDKTTLLQMHIMKGLLSKIKNNIAYDLFQVLTSLKKKWSKEKLKGNEQSEQITYSFIGNLCSAGTTNSNDPIFTDDSIDIQRNKRNLLAMLSKAEENARRYNPNCNYKEGLEKLIEANLAATRIDKILPLYYFSRRANIIRKENEKTIELPLPIIDKIMRHAEII